MSENLETLEISKKRGGNTSSPRVVPSKRWCFTFFFNDIRDLENLETSFGVLKCKWIIGLEKCPNTQKEHFQGYIECPLKIRPVEKFKKIFNREHFNKIHWEKCKGTKEENIEYCMKDGCFHTNFQIPKDPLEQFIKEKKLYQFQKKVINIINEKPDERSIYWFYEEEGCKGKTSLMKHICMKYENSIYLNGKGADVKFAIASSKEKPNICLFGYPREKEDFVSYSSLEEVKDGIFFSGKFESKMYVNDSPHVIVFSNFYPNKEKLSKDRWKIFNIKNNGDYEDVSEVQHRSEGLHPSKLRPLRG